MRNAPEFWLFLHLMSPRHDWVHPLAPAGQLLEVVEVVLTPLIWFNLLLLQNIKTRGDWWRAGPSCMQYYLPDSSELWEMLKLKLLAKVQLQSVLLSTLDNNVADYLLAVSKLHRTLTKKPQDLPCQHNRQPASQTPPVNFPPTLLPSQFFVSKVPV